MSHWIASSGKSVTNSYTETIRMRKRQWLNDTRSSNLEPSREFEEVAEGARFELAAHGVGAGFQDRWIKPLSHPSENDLDDLR